MSADTQLAGIKQLIGQVGEKSIFMLAGAVKSVTKSDLKAAADARKYEKEVDELCRAIDERCVDYIAARQPIEAELRLLIATLKISSELERIADYGNNIAKLAQNNFSYLDLTSLKPLFGAFEEMAQKAVSMVKDSLRAYENGSQELCKSVLEQDRHVNYLNKSLFKGILAVVTVKPWTQEVALDFHIAVRYLERVADRSTNIAEWVFYANSGHYYTAN